MSTGGGEAIRETKLEWTAADPITSVSTARFEFHLGHLVAVRAHLSEQIPGAQVDATAESIVSRKPAFGAGTEFVMLARDCSTHAGEATALLTRQR